MTWPRRQLHWIALLAVTSAAVVDATTGTVAAPKKQASALAAAERTQRTERRRRLATVRSWGYQLRLIDIATIAASPFDLVVTDHALAANRRFVREFSREEIERMKTRPDGSRRIVLAYLSIGEAERYRFYWQQEWYEAGKAPPWLASANDRWEGNWRVRFWDPGWQALILNAPGNYLDRLKAQGFDGIYLDRADVYEEMLAERPTARADMLRFVRDIAAAARRDSPGFLVVMQNAEELLRDTTLRQGLDGVAKEDLLFGVGHDERANPPEMIAESLSDLRRARSAGLAVLMVEYLWDPRHAAEATGRARREGFVFLNAERSLGTLANPLAEAAPLDASRMER